MPPKTQVKIALLTIALYYGVAQSSAAQLENKIGPARRNMPPSETPKNSTDIWKEKAAEWVKNTIINFHNPTQKTGLSKLFNILNPFEPSPQEHLGASWLIAATTNKHFIYEKEKEERPYGKEFAIERYRKNLMILKNFLDKKILSDKDVIRHLKNSNLRYIIEPYCYIYEQHPFGYEKYGMFAELFLIIFWQNYQRDPKKIFEKHNYPEYLEISQFIREGQSFPVRN